ncbi:RAD50-interacting protein 1 [Galdieria sulphuraria]|nr:RAD50-interacting protein 1 [Galdieria sulphuraria]
MEVNISSLLETKGLASFFDNEFVVVDDVQKAGILCQKCAKELEDLNKEEEKQQQNWKSSVPALKEQIYDFRVEFQRLSDEAKKFKVEMESLLGICREAANIAIDSLRTYNKIVEALEEEDGDAALRYVRELLFVSFPEEKQVQQLLDELSSDRVRKYLQDVASRRQDSIAQVRDMLQRRIMQTLEQLGFEKDVLCFHGQAQRWKKIQKMIVQLDELQYYVDKSSITDYSGMSTIEQLGVRWYLIPLCHNIVSRFEYHFLSNRETARIDKPEWASTFLLERWHEMQPVLEEGIQEALDRAREGRDEELEDAVVVFARYLLHLFGRKIARDVASLGSFATNAQLSIDSQEIFFHLIDHSIQLDDSLRKFLQDRLILEPTPSSLEEAHHQNPAFLATWTAAELTRSQDSVQQAITKLVKGDSGAVEEILTTLVAMCERAKALPSLSLRAQFVRLTQIPLLETLRMELLSYLQDDMYQVIEDHLYRCILILNAANHIQKHLEDWKNDIFYLELVPYLAPSFSERPNGAALELDMLSKTIIQDEVEHFSRLHKSFVSHVQRILERQFRENAKTYVAIYHYSSREDQRSWVLRLLSSEDLSPELTSAFSHLRTHFNLLSSVLQDTKVSAEIWRPLAYALDRFFFHDIVLSCGDKEMDLSEMSFHSASSYFINILSLQLLNRPIVFFPLMHDIDSLLSWLEAKPISSQFFESIDSLETGSVEQRFVDLCQQLELLETDEQVESVRVVLRERYGINSLHPYLLKQVLLCLRTNFG